MSNDAVTLVAESDRVQLVVDETAGMLVFDRQTSTPVQVPSTQPVVIRDEAVSPQLVVGNDSSPQLVMAGFKGDRGAQGAAGGATFIAVAGSDLGYPVIVAIVDDIAHAADPTSAADMISKLAVTTQAAASGTPITVAAQYELTEGAWNWSPGRIYLAAVGGGLTQTPPTTGALLEVGRATSPTTIQFAIQPAILR